MHRTLVVILSLLAAGPYRQAIAQKPKNQPRSTASILSTRPATFASPLMFGIPFNRSGHLWSSTRKGTRRKLVRRASLENWKQANEAGVLNDYVHQDSAVGR
jgi:hypothetical protein